MTIKEKVIYKVLKDLPYIGRGDFDRIIDLTLKEVLVKLEEFENKFVDEDCHACIYDRLVFQQLKESIGGSEGVKPTSKEEFK